jgi:hypothetical protein
LRKSSIRTQISDKSTETVQKFNNDNYKDYANRINNNLFNNKTPVKNEKESKDISSKFSKAIKIESLLAILVLLVASLLTITSPPSRMSYTPMIMMGGSDSSHSSSSSSSSLYSTMANMPMAPVKNSTYVKQTNIMNVITKIEINPFYYLRLALLIQKVNHILKSQA